MPPRRLAIPTRGAADFTAFVDQPDGFAPYGSIQNVRPYNAGGRQQVGRRPGLTKAFALQAGGAWQGMCVVPKATGVTGYSVSNGQRITSGTSRESSLVYGQTWVLDSRLGLVGNFQDLYGDVPGYGAFCVGWHPTAKRFAQVIIALNGGKVVSHVAYMDADPSSATFRQALWTATCEDKDPGGSAGSVPINANQVLVDTTFTFVVGSAYVYVFLTADGTYVKRTNLYGWAQECKGICKRTDGRLAILMDGSMAQVGPVTTNSASLTTPSNNPADHEGRHFRAGVWLFDITSDTSVNGTPLTPVQFGAKKDGAYTYYEDHPYFRFSENGAAQPRGYIVNGICALADGGVAVARCNRGWGPNNTFRPDFSVPRLPVAVISAGTSDAVLSGEYDFDSIEDAYTGSFSGSPYYNDIPKPGNTSNSPTDPHPSADCIAADPDGNLYVAGRKHPTTGYSVRKLSADGLVQWTVNVGGWVPQNGVKFNSKDNTVLVVGQRNDTYEDADSGAYAVLWKIDAGSGDILDHFDLGKVTDAYGVDVNANGDIVICTLYVTSP